MDLPSTQDDWTVIIGLFHRSEWRRHLGWISGVSPRMRARRIKALFDLPAAGPLAALLDQRNDRRIKALRTYAAINMEQAAAALRMTVIVNVSIPVIILTILSQTTSGRFWTDVLAIVSDDSSGLLALIATFLTVIILLFFFIGAGAKRLGTARDIRHLIDLLAADRGIYFGLDDTDDLQSD